VGRDARYRFSLLPGLWKRQDLLTYIMRNDTAWTFEETSHLRGRRTRSRVLTVNRHVFRTDGRQIYPFDPHGGIVRGKWVRGSVVDLFKQHGIEVDFSRRGFFDEAPARTCPPLTFSRRIYNGICWRVKARINEAIDRFRY
jgi:hypothetical protein